MKALKHNSPEYLHYLAEGMKMVFADRQKYMADTAFVKVPLAGLSSKGYAKELADKIRKYDVMKDVPAGDPLAFDGSEKAEFVGGGGNKHISTSSFCCGRSR